jgi:hypothetical protein
MEYRTSLLIIKLRTMKIDYFGDIYERMQNAETQKTSKISRKRRENS